MAICYTSNKKLIHRETVGREQGESSVKEKLRGKTERGQEAEGERNRIQERKGIPEMAEGKTEMKTS